jgi:hypothetical protein
LDKTYLYEEEMMEPRSPVINISYKNPKQGNEVRYYAITSGAHVDLSNNVQEMKTEVQKANMIFEGGNLNNNNISEVKTILSSLEQKISGSFISINGPIKDIQTSIFKGNKISGVSLLITLLSLLIGILALIVTIHQFPK